MFIREDSNNSRSVKQKENIILSHKKALKGNHSSRLSAVKYSQDNVEL